MKLKVIFFLVCLSSSLSAIVNAFSISDVKCFGATFHDLRIRGCREPPCKILTGQRLPYELDISLNHYQRQAKKAENVKLNVIIPNYRNTDHTTLDRASCESGNLGFRCPMISNKKYTIRSNLYIAPKGGDQYTNQDSTGLKVAHFEWKTSPSNGWSMCWFDVKLNIIA